MAAAVSIAALGCRNETQEFTGPVAVPIRTDVPLRIVWVGESADADVLQRTWASISEQSLDVRLITPPRAVNAGASQSGMPPDELLEQAATADVLIYPLAMMGELATKKRVMPLLDDQFNALGKSEAVDAGDVFTSVDRVTVPVALRMATTFSRERIATPLGGHLPAVLLGENAFGANDGSDDDNIAIATWDDYDALVEKSEGKCCEPTAPTWAGAMYLWRLASSLSATWLFDRETLQPLFSQPDYVAVLERMQTTVKRTDEKYRDYTPNHIFQGIVEGTLRCGIGFPQGDKPSGDEVSSGAIRIVSLPGNRVSADDTLSVRLDNRRIMMDPFMMVGSLAASCRQTKNADVFIKWLSGGAGSEPLYRSIASMIDTTTAASESSSDPQEQYRGWLNKQLTSAAVVPTLQLTSASEYYDILDETVRSCVLGEVTAQAACDKITEAWSRLNRTHDLPSQQRMWRRAQAIS